MPTRSCLSIILAAGEGTRMKSALPKVLHPIAGLPMVAHVARAAAAAGGGDIAVVVGRGAEAVEAARQAVCGQGREFRAGRAARHGACRACRPRCGRPRL